MRKEDVETFWNRVKRNVLQNSIKIGGQKCLFLITTVPKL